VLNEIVWRNFSTDMWVKIETFAFPVILFAFLTLQIVGLQKYVIEDDSDS
jgi:intracellular septation protein